MPLASLMAQLIREIRVYIKKYHDAWLICDDSACATKTRQVAVYGKRCLMSGCRGAMVYQV